MTASTTPAALADHDAILRTFDPFDYTNLWADRDTRSKTRIVVREAAGRLDGMSLMLYSLALGARSAGNKDTERFVFLAKAIGDVVRVLNSLDVIHKAEDDAEFEANVKAERAEKRTRKR